MNTKEMEKTLNQRAEYMRMRDELDALIASLTDTVKSEMAAENVDTMTAGAFKVTWKTVKRETIDGKRLQAENPEIYNAYKRTTETRPFTVRC